MKTLGLALAAAAALSAPAAASPRTSAPPPAGEEVHIPFANFGAIRSFEADGTDAVYLQDQHHNWYRAELIGPCQGLPFAFRIGFDNRGSSTVDRFSTLLVEGQRCKISSLTRSGPPPKKRKAGSR